jgi:hypothetical protein
VSGCHDFVSIYAYSVSYLDTPGHFSRSISELSKSAGVWLKPLGTTPTLDKRPTTILVFQESQKSYIEPNISAMNDFVRDLEVYSGVLRTSASVGDLWYDDKIRPHNAPSLTEYLQNVST